MGKPLGLLYWGNVDLNNRPIVRNPDGTISTVRSMSIGTDQGEVLIPTVSEDGRIMSDEEAIQQYNATGRHLGIFDNPYNATTYAASLHNSQDEQYSSPDPEIMKQLNREADLTGDRTKIIAYVRQFKK